MNLGIIYFFIIAVCDFIEGSVKKKSKGISKWVQSRIKGSPKNRNRPRNKKKKTTKLIFDTISTDPDSIETTSGANDSTSIDWSQSSSSVALEEKIQPNPSLRSMDLNSGETVSIQSSSKTSDSSTIFDDLHFELNVRDFHSEEEKRERLEFDTASLSLLNDSIETPTVDTKDKRRNQSKNQKNNSEIKKHNLRKNQQNYKSEYEINPFTPVTRNDGRKKPGRIGGIASENTIKSKKQEQNKIGPIIVRKSKTESNSVAYSEDPILLSSSYSHDPFKASNHPLVVGSKIQTSHRSTKDGNPREIGPIIVQRKESKISTRDESDLELNVTDLIEEDVHVLQKNVFELDLDKDIPIIQILYEKSGEDSIEEFLWNTYNVQVSGLAIKSLENGNLSMHQLIRQSISRHISIYWNDYRTEKHSEYLEFPFNVPSCSEIGLEDLENEVLIGSGVGGEVYKVKVQPESIDLAKKIFKSLNDRQNFYREIRVLSDPPLKGSPRIVCFRESDLGQSYEYLMRLFKGGDLSNVFPPSVPIEQSYIAKFGYDLILAVFSLHQKNILHLDIKPENIIIDGPDKDYVERAGMSLLDYEALLIDFGSSLTISEASKCEGTQKFIGDSRYMAPESMDGSSLTSIGRGTDWWLVGATLYELGIKYFTRGDINAENNFLAHFQHGKIIRFPESFSTNLKSLIKSLLVLDGTKRDFSKDLDAFDKLKSHPFFDVFNGDYLKPAFNDDSCPENEDSGESLVLKLSPFDVDFKKDLNVIYSCFMESKLDVKSFLEEHYSVNVLDQEYSKEKYSDFDLIKYSLKRHVVLNLEKEKGTNPDVKRPFKVPSCQSLKLSDESYPQVYKKGSNSSLYKMTTELEDVDLQIISFEGSNRYDLFINNSIKYELLHGKHLAEPICFHKDDQSQIYRIMVPYHQYDFNARFSQSDKTLPFDQSFAARAFNQAFHGLYELHHSGILHLAISPEHFELADDGSVVLAGFEESIRYIYKIGYQNRVNDPYSAPEQRNPLLSEQVGRGTDWYRLGVSLWKIAVKHHYSRDESWEYLSQFGEDRLPQCMDKFDRNLCHLIQLLTSGQESERDWSRYPETFKVIAKHAFFEKQ